MFSAGSSFAAYCGDDVCGPDESCKNCKWDCGVCDPFDKEGSSGEPIGVAPPKKTVRIFNGQEYLNYPISASAYTKSGENDTSIRINLINPYPIPTEAFRLQIEAKASWFYPKNFSYALEPDGYTQSGWPYWDMPPLEHNESVEISFIVKSKIGSTNLINAKAQPLNKWSGGCRYLVPSVLSRNKSAEAKAISEYVFSLNQTQNVTVYFEQSQDNTSLILALVGPEYGVFRIDNTNVSVVTDKDTISGLVREYVAANSPQTTLNESVPYEIIKYSKEAKRGPEDSCLLITGMDRHRCVDRQSCFYSCFSVPVCSYIATGWEFIDTMLDYKKTIDAADSSLNKSMDSAYAFKVTPTYRSATAALSDMKTLNKAETNVVYHPLFTVYNFCQPADYAIPKQIEARRVLLDYLDENCLYGEDMRIINMSMQLGVMLSALENITIEKNVTADNITTTPALNVTINETNISKEGEDQINEHERTDCCTFGVCSVMGIEQIYGLCWEWWLLILVLIIVGLAALLRRKIRIKRKISR
jgi:hypothetical protein